ncbi:endoplasmic reticulum resident protein 44-like [Hetaerina americana]|uniref:endoplasmic reticulum resident protein 44-like n=1 Tax=Hetaerina americana TaxID=62018 RepID=UPI003A7F4E5E
MKMYYSRESGDLRLNYVLFILVSYLFYNPTDSGAVQLTTSNMDTMLASNELVMINFYADWCRFSNLLGPIFDEAADKVSAEFPEPGRVVLGKVDCDKEGSLASRFHISKYPTLKVIRNGLPAKKEYRGQRSAEALLAFIQKQMVDPVKELASMEDPLLTENAKKRIIIGYFDTKDGKDYDAFRRTATNLKDDCLFLVGLGESFSRYHPRDTAIITFRPPSSTGEEGDSFKGDITSVDALSAWAGALCVPIVREITFENAEELTEEGLPFLILFHSPDDTKSVAAFNQIVNKELLGEKQNVNFLTADGARFAHPLHHLGKSQSDLPLVAIDSFRHMYLFPHPASRMEEPGLLKSFLQDLYSGKLHREFHYGPDTTHHHAAPIQIGMADNQVKGATSPPESTFKKLAPSKNRYTLLRDEL